MSVESNCNREGSARRKLVYILSPSFSGSTLLTMLLAQHPRIATIGELKATAMGPTNEYVCSCEQAIRSCPFWKTLKERCADAGVSFDVSDFGTHFESSGRLKDRVMGAQVRGKLFERVRKTLLDSPVLGTTYRKILQRNARLIELICELQGGSLFLDGSKDPQRLMYFQRSGNWDIHVLRLHRDGRAQSNSRRQKTRNPVDFPGAVAEWRGTILQMDRVCQSLGPDQIHTLQYERLCGDPQKVMGDIWRFLDVEPVEQDWSKVDLRKREHHILGNSMRTKDKIKISMDTKWRERVSKEELELFEREAGELNRSLGYTTEPVSGISGREHVTPQV
ncbi:MAG: hypothetical protein EOP14_03815 [Pseudomonas sp.]|nr:MAG: hypothetical protein EOP14_03815 [Pseudomonas sp.]